MSTDPEGLTCPFRDKDVRKSWLDVLEYLEDDEMQTMTYREWLEVAKDEAFVALSEDLNELLRSVEALERYNEFRLWFERLQAEQMYLNRRGRARAK
jgi:hypothetical protein